MNTPHTPGNWHLTQSDAGTIDVCKSSGDIRSIICRLHVEHLAEEHGGNIMANAQLIASAPELLAQRDSLKAALELDITYHSRPFVGDSMPEFRLAGYKGPTESVPMNAFLDGMKRAALTLSQEAGK